MTSFGKFVLKKGHVLLNGTSKFGISQRMQELFCLVGQSVVYEEASELFLKLLGIEISAPQIQRVCINYGTAIDPLVQSNCESVIPRLKEGAADDPVYVMVDGSMLFTQREIGIVCSTSI